MERERHIEDLKKIASLSKNKKNVKTQKQRNLLGKNVITAIKGIGSVSYTHLTLPTSDLV